MSMEGCTYPEKDREILRTLAQRVAEISSLPIQAERTRLWKAVNSLQPIRPVVLAFNEDLGGHTCPVAVEENRCTNPLLRSWEKALRLKIFEHEYIQDDHPVTNLFNIGWVVRLSKAGLEASLTRDGTVGFDTWDHPIRNIDDLEQLRFREVSVDRDLTNQYQELAKEIFGDILDVRVTCGPGWRGQDYATLGGQWWSDNLCDRLVRLRGLEQVMYDMYERPGFLHRLLAFLRDDMLQILNAYEREGILSMNNGPDDYIGSGALGATDQLAETGQGQPVSLAQLWGLGESQDFSGVGPDLWQEFMLEYELPIINQFGLVCYGCCEPLDKKYNLLLKHVRNLRRISVTSPYANFRLAAQKLSNRYVLSWKPSPTWLSAGIYDEDLIKSVTRETIRIAQENQCCLEIVMKGFRSDYNRLARWAEITSRIVDETM
jgi:hypothetical protein